MKWSKSELWEKLNELITAEGLKLFDLDLPMRGKSSVLRIYITRGKQGGDERSSSGINLDDCAAVSRAIRNHESLSSLLDDYNVEVSSPGINRKLQRPEHFQGAIGERVRVTTSISDREESIRGVIRAFDGQLLELEVEGAEEIKKVPLQDVKRANVDFQFDIGRG